MPCQREITMINGKTIRVALAACVLGGAFIAAIAGTAHAIDPGLGVGRPGPGVHPRVGAPGVGVAPGVAVVGGPVYVLPRGCVTVIVNGVKMWRCGTVVYRRTVQAGRTVYVVVP